MGQVLQFRLPPARDEVQPGAELDLLSAVDFALRDLIDPETTPVERMEACPPGGIFTLVHLRNPDATQQARDAE